VTFDQGADKQQISRRVVDLVHRHQKPNAPAMTANKVCHQNNRGLAALIERR
jgi:hypothetical protein